MGNTGEETDKTSYSSGTVDFYDDEFETQVVNLAGETQVVEPINDDFETQVVEPINDDFETQLVNPLEETQVLDIACETQILSVCDETQLLDDPIPDCVKNMDFDTQILNDFDDEMAGDDFYDDQGTVTTEINVDDNLHDDESAQSFDQSVEEKGQLTSPLGYDARKDLEVLPNTLPEKFCNSGIILLIICIKYEYFLWLSSFQLDQNLNKL